ncbi:MAG: DUF2974 domain-containing protein [Erysipelotrichaceae bacterium]|nr:DUF2974 domain-containing protein [Erysipelotrichaceae bacterium]
MNFLDYCKWRGDLSFKQDPFNEVDNMCFAQIAYCELDDIFKDKEKMTLKEVSDAYFSTHKEEEIEKSTSFSRLSPILMREMAATRRFASCLVYNYADKLLPDSSKQFAAVMFDLPDESTVIAFRGTDDTLVGWKEDLMLSYGDINSQYDALDYVNNNCTMFNKYRVVGHSKGGYLAIYATIHAKPAVKRRIIEVYSDDGPGLRDGNLDKEDLEFLKTKYKLIVPEKDGVGMIYEMAKNKKICKVDVFNIVSAHSMFTWQVEGNSVVRADRFKYESDLSREVILDILHETTKEERSIFVNELFDHLAMENINTLSEFADRGIGIIYSTLKKLMDENNESRIFAGKMMKILSRNISSDLQQTISAGRDIVMEKVSDLSSSAGKKIRNMLPGKKNEKSSEEDKEITGESSDTRK